MNPASICRTTMVTFVLDAIPVNAAFPKCIIKRHDGLTPGNMLSDSPCQILSNLNANFRDHWALSCMNRCPDLVVCLKRDLQCLRPEASLVLIFRPNVAGMKGRVDLAQPVNTTPDLWCGSPIHYHSTLIGEK
ncbi:hypothetical protein TNCV_4572521 [Trichonephila clavipes]|nr:hypothetical protein TNCV_4572521 [Trichonephila clavipes]